MENTEVMEQNDSWSNDLNDWDLNGIRNEVSSASIYGDGLESPILGSSFRVPDIPKRYIEPIALDTSLPYVSMSLSITWYSMVFVLEAGIFKSEYRRRLFYLYCYLKSELVIDRFMVEYLYDKFIFPDSSLYTFENIWFKTYRKTINTSYIVWVTIEMSVSKRWFFQINYFHNTKFFNIKIL